MWAPPPPEPPPVGWWHEWSYRQHVNRGLADRQAREQDRRRAELRRKVQRTLEALCLAESAAPAYRVEAVGRAARHLSGLPYERRSAGSEVEQFVGVQVDPRWQAWLDEAEYSRTNRVR